jgi:hypothetical protein
MKINHLYFTNDKAVEVVEHLKLQFNNFIFQNKVRHLQKKLYAPSFDINDSSIKSK